jgi:type I restriction enzyme S subunit
MVIRMTKIFELLKHLAPEGVLKRSLWEVTIWDKKFNGVEKTKQKTNIEFRHVSAELLKTMSNVGQVKLLSTGNFEGWTTEEIAGNYLNNSEVISIPSGGTANIKYYSGKFVDSGNILAVSSDKNSFSLKYVYYWLLNNNSIIQNYFRGSGVKHPDMKGILELMIPIPPLEIQNEIVRILDNFSKLEAKLEAELEAELEARTQQYEYYRNKLLDFSNGFVGVPKIDKMIKEFCPEGVNRFIISDVFEFRNGYTPSKAKSEYWDNGTIPWFRMEDIRKNGSILNDSIQKVTILAVKNKPFPKNSIIVGTTATIGVHALITVDSLANQQFTYLMLKKEFNSRVSIKYFYYYMYIIDLWLQNSVTKNGFALVNTNNFKKIEIPLPPLEIQNEIVKILDSFSELVTSISEGLPAEIKARKQQYEYYRNKLLNFEEQQ